MDRTCFFNGSANRRRIDLLESDAIDRFSQFLQSQCHVQMPGNRLTLPIRVGTEIDGISLLGSLFELRNPAGWLGQNSIMRFEVLRLDADLLFGKIANMTEGSLHRPARAQVLFDLAGLARGFNDEEVAGHEKTSGFAASGTPFEIKLSWDSLLRTSTGSMFGKEVDPSSWAGARRSDCVSFMMN